MTLIIPLQDMIVKCVQLLNTYFFNKNNGYNMLLKNALKAEKRLGEIKCGGVHNTV